MWFAMARRSCLIAAALFAFGAESAAAQSLEDVVAKVARSHPVIESVRAQSRSAEQRIAEEQGALLPRVDLSSAAGEEFTNSRFSRQQPNDHDTAGLPRYDNALTIRQLLLDGGATDSRIASARASSEAARQRLNDVGQRVGLLAVEVYIEVLRARASLARAEANVAVHDDILAGIELRARTGVGRGTDVDQARARVALAEATLAQRRGALEEATSRYLETAGETPGGLRRPNDPERLAPPALDATLARALANSPAVKAAGANVAARAADRAATEGAFWPRFTFEVTGRTDRNVDAIRGPDSDLTAQVRMNYSIYAGGADTARERRAIEDLVAAKFDESEAQRRVRETVRVAHSGFVAAKARLVQLRNRAETTRRLVGAYRRQFELNQRSLLDVLDVQNEAFAADVAVIDIEYTIIFAHYQLLAASGELLIAFNVSVSPSERI